MSLLLLATFVAPVWAKAPKKAAAPPPPVAEPAPPPPDPEAWRATAPAPGPEKPWSPPAAKTFTLTNGVPVYLVENPGLPLVTTWVVMNVGREANPAGKAGLGSLTANLLDEGTTTRDASTLASDAARLGANLYVGAGEETSWVGVDALGGGPLPATLDLLADVTLHPGFAKADFARVQAEVITSIQSARAEPRDVVSRTFAAQYWGPEHPYGTPPIGSEESVGSLKRKDVQKFYKTWWHAGNAAIIVAGAVDEATLKPLLEARFGAWEKGDATRLQAPAPAVPEKTRVVFVEQPGAVQSVIRVGTSGPRRAAPEYMSANVAGTIVGGMFSSRLNINLREEHGWSYGAYGGFTEARDHGLFLARTSVQADKTAPAVVEILKELAAAGSKPPSDADLKLAKDNLLKSLPGFFETNGSTAGAFAGVPGWGLPIDMWAKWPAELDKADTAAVAAQAKRAFEPAHMLIVVAGPRSLEAPGADGKPATIDVVGELKGLGYEFVELK